MKNNKETDCLKDNLKQVTLTVEEKEKILQNILKQIDIKSITTMASTKSIVISQL